MAKQAPPPEKNQCKVGMCEANNPSSVLSRVWLGIKLKGTRLGIDQLVFRDKAIDCYDVE